MKTQKIKIYQKKIEVQVLYFTDSTGYKTFKQMVSKNHALQFKSDVPVHYFKSNYTLK